MGKLCTRAYLCARGFEEDTPFRTDSPTSTREGIRVVFSTIASMRWTIKAIDMKTVFLQGKKMEKEVFLGPPKEANTSNIWCLNKCVYGLSDASRRWYLRLREELLTLEATQSVLHQGLFYWFYDHDPICVMAVFVDDIILAGTKSWRATVMDSLKTTFSFGPESSEMFTYIDKPRAQ